MPTLDIQAFSLVFKTKIIDNETPLIGTNSFLLHAPENAQQISETYEKNKVECRIIAAPGAAQGATCRSILEFVDFYPTITEKCGLKCPDGLAGKSLGPVLSNPAAPFKDAAFTLVTRGPKIFGQSVRTDRWRFIQWTDGVKELYDHESDSEENYNVAKRFPEIVAALAAKLKSLPPYPRNP